MATKVWIETGGDTGGMEAYAEDGAVNIIRWDWDEWGEDGPDTTETWNRITEALISHGAVMPDRTRELLVVALHEIWMDLQ